MRDATLTAMVSSSSTAPDGPAASSPSSPPPAPKVQPGPSPSPLPGPSATRTPDARLARCGFTPHLLHCGAMPRRTTHAPILIAVACTLLIVGTTVLSQQASAQSLSTVLQIHNAVDKGYCLDANSNGYYEDGDTVALWSCNNHPEQQWYISGTHIKNVDGLCLGVPSLFWPNIRGLIWLWTCDNNPEQQWYISGTNTKHIRNVDGLCLDAASTWYPSNGDPLQSWYCNNHSEQLWTMSS